MEQNEKRLNDFTKKAFTGLKIFQAFDPFFLINNNGSVNKSTKLGLKLMREFTTVYKAEFINLNPY